MTGHGNRMFARPIAATAVLVCLLLAGCGQFNLKKTFPWGAGDFGELQAPLKVVAMWTDTVLNQPNQPALRGFGGRLMFYREENERPVKVEGSLVVYAFDESKRDPTNVTPDRKFVFTKEQVAKHYSKSNLGHSYSFWLPFDEVGGERREISLLVRFTSTQGSAIVSDQTLHMLPGREPPPPPPAPKRPEMAGEWNENGDWESSRSLASHDQESGTGRFGNHDARGGARQDDEQFEDANQVRRVAYETGDSGDVERASLNGPLQSGRRRMSTTTIELPSTFGRLTPSATTRQNPPIPLAPDFRASQEPARGDTLNRVQGTGEARDPAQAESRYGPRRYRPLGESLSRLPRDRDHWPQRRGAFNSDPRLQPEGTTANDGSTIGTGGTLGER